MGHFQLFSMILKFSVGHFLSFLHRLLWAIFQVKGTRVHDPLPSQSLELLDELVEIWESMKYTHGPLEVLLFFR